MTLAKTWINCALFSILIYYLKRQHWFPSQKLSKVLELHTTKMRNKFNDYSFIIRWFLHKLYVVTIERQSWLASRCVRDLLVTTLYMHFNHFGIKYRSSFNYRNRTPVLWAEIACYFNFALVWYSYCELI